jgi:hypothetical protein
MFEVTVTDKTVYLLFKMGLYYILISTLIAIKFNKQFLVAEYAK